MNSLAFSSKQVNRFEAKLNICQGKQELVRTCRGKNPTVLKLAVDSINLGLCESRDYFACPLLTAQKNRF